MDVNKVFVKIQKKIIFFLWGGGGVGRIGVWLGGVRVDVNEEFKFLRKSTKKISGGHNVGGRG